MAISLVYQLGKRINNHYARQTHGWNPDAKLIEFRELEKKS